MPNNNQYVDERIVQMRIDHEQFEKGAKSTINVLDKLKDSLDFKKAQKAVDDFDLSPMSNSIEKVTSSFNALQVAGQQVIRRLTDDVYNFAKKTAKSLIIDPVTSGWDKYADKTKAVQTIMSATAADWEDTDAQMEYVNAQMERLNWFTDETSYNFLDMANNIGKFTSNGIALDDAVTAMQGISTWAAISGAGVSEAGRAMYNLSQAMGVGAVKLMDWKSIENANMATREFKQTAIDTAVAIGTLKKVGDNLYETSKNHQFTIEQFNTQLSDEWFTSDVLTKTLDKYGAFSVRLGEVSEATGKTATELLGLIKQYKQTGKVSSDVEAYIKELASAEYDLGLRSFQAAQEAKTFTEAIDATKDAVSTGWMNIFENIFGNYQQAKGLWTDVSNFLYDIFAEPINDIKDVTKYAFQNDSYSKIIRTLAGAGIKTEEFQNIVTEMARTNGDDIDGLLEKYGNLQAAFQSGELNADYIRKAIERLSGSLSKDGLSGNVVDFEQKLLEVQDLVKGILRGTYGNGQERIDALTELGWDPAFLQNLADRVYTGGSVTIKDLEEIADQLGVVNNLTKEQKDLLVDFLNGTGDLENLEDLLSNITQPSGYQLFVEALHNIMELFEDINGVVTEAFEEVFGTAEERGNILYILIKRFRDFTESIKINANTLDVLRSVLIKVFSYVKSAIKIISRLNQIIRAILGVIGNIVSFIFSLFKKNDVRMNPQLTETYTILDTLLPILDWTARAIENIGGRIAKLFGWIKNGWDYIKDLPIVQDAISKIGDVLTDIPDHLSKAWEAIKNINISTATFTEIFDKIKSIATFIYDGLFGNTDEFVKKAEEFFGTLWSAIISSIQKIKWDQLIEAGRFGLLAWLIWRIDKFFKSLTSVANQGRNIIEKFGGLMDGLKAPFTALSQSIKYNKFIKTALAIGILAGSLYLLSKIPTDVLMNVAVTLAFLMLVMAKLVKATENTKSFNLFNKVSESLEVKDNSVFRNINTMVKVIPDLMGALIGMAAIIAAIGYTGKVFKDMDLQQIYIVLGIVLGTIVVITIAIKILSKNLKGMKNVGSVLIGIALIIGAVAAAGFILQKLSWPQMAALLVGFSLLIAAIGYTIKGVRGFKKENALGAALTIMTLTAAIYALSIPIGILGFLPFERLAQGLIMVVTILVVLSAAVTFLSGVSAGKDGDNKNLLKVAASFIILAIAIDALVPALALLSALDITKLFGAMAVLSALLVVMGFVLLFTGSNAMNPKNLILFSVAILIMATALAVSAIGLSIFTSTLMGLIQLPWSDMEENVDAFVQQLKKIAPVLTLVGLAALMFGLGLLAGGLAVLAFAAGTALISANILAIAAAIWLVSEALPKLAEGIVKFVEIVEQHGDKIIKFIGWLMAAIALAIVAKKLEVAKAFMTIGEQILNVISGLGPKGIAVLQAFIITAGAWLLGLIQPIANFLVIAIASIIQSVANALRSNEDLLISAISNLFSVLLEFTLKVLVKFIGGIIAFIGELFADGARLLGFDDIADKAEAGVQGVLNIMDEMSAGIEKSVRTSFWNDNVDAELSKLGSNWGTSFKNSFNESAALNSNDGMQTDGLNNEYDFESKGTEAGNAYNSGVEKSITGGIPLVSDAAKLLSNDSSTNSQDTFNLNGKSLGTYMDSGVANGIYSGSWMPRNAALWLAEDIYNTTAGSPFMLVKSPSKAYERLAEYIPEGMALGIKNKSNIVTEAMDESAHDMYNVMADAMTQVAMIADKDFNIDPTIRPVVDMSNVEQSAGLINGLFSGNSSIGAALGSSINRRMAATERVAGDMANRTTIQNSGDTFNFTINGAEYQDEDAIADAVMNRIQGRYMRLAVARG